MRDRKRSRAPFSTRTPGATGNFGVGSRDQIVSTLYDHYTNKLGWTPEAARTMIAQVGRENGYNPTTIFGTHRDANPRVRTLNAGMVSWNDTRAFEFRRFMEERGFLKNGRLEQSEASLRAQADFSDDEMKRRYAPSARAVRTPGLTYDQIEPVLSRNYYVWDREGKHVLGARGARQHRERMRRYYDEIGRR